MSEETSPEVAHIAGTILRAFAKVDSKEWVLLKVTTDGRWPDDQEPLCSVGELKALAASALTQAPNRKSRRRS